MKNIYLILTVFALSLVSCNDLDLYPLDQGSSETWYSNETEYEMAVNDLYRTAFWPVAKEAWSDDYLYRDVAGPDIVDGTLNSETNTSGSVELATFYTNQYKAIARSNAIIANLDRGRENGINEATLLSYEAQARFSRAAHYAMLVFAFGDVVYVEDLLTIEDASKMARSSKADVIKIIYDDFDYAAEHLPASYTGKQVATKGAALALKARYALYFGDYEIAATAAKACMDLGIYKLHKDYGDLFYTKNAEESIFLLPRSTALLIGNIGDAKSYYPRTAGGFSSKVPSWALLAAYECTDGKLIDESPLFDSHNPFRNRDPRCTASIVEFGSEFVGYEYTPHPEVTKVMDYSTGKLVNNNDTRARAQFASFTGLVWRKSVDRTWGPATNFTPENDLIIIRYADVLLIYAEAKIELNQIDQSVLDAINQVRARAYGVELGDVSNYPAITTTNQKELRTVLRRERRVELAFEGLRYYDLIRWGLAQKALNKPNCGVLYPGNELIDKVVKPGHWFWPYAPEIDEDGIADFSRMVSDGYVQVCSKGAFSERQYLWPIPAKELVINPNMTQNPGY